MTMMTDRPTSAVLPTLLLLRELLIAHGEVTIRRADLGALMGLTHFDENRVYLDASLQPGDWWETLLHELIHLRRGPAGCHLADVEEAHVEAATRELVDRAQVLLDRAPSTLLAAPARSLRLVSS